MLYQRKAVWCLAFQLFDFASYRCAHSLLVRFARIPATEIGRCGPRAHRNNDQLVRREKLNVLPEDACGEEAVVPSDPPLIAVAGPLEDFRYCGIPANLRKRRGGRCLLCPPGCYGGTIVTVCGLVFVNFSTISRDNPETTL